METNIQDVLFIAKNNKGFSALLHRRRRRRTQDLNSASFKIDRCSSRDRPSIETCLWVK